MSNRPRGTSELIRIQAELTGVHDSLTTVVAGSRGKGLIDDLRDTIGGTASEILWQALLADCLRVLHGAVIADGEITESEIDALYGMLSAAAVYYARTQRSEYGEFSVVDRESIRAFLDRYAADRGPLGRGARLHWPGLALCRRAAELGEPDALCRYEPAMSSLIAEACRVGGVADTDPRWRHRVDEVDELRRMLAGEAAASGSDVDRRVQAFLSPTNVFSAVQQAWSVFENDPFDVDAVHRDARSSFEQLVTRAITRPQIADLGQMLLVLGDSGAGKTHVLRGFRRYVQEGNRGFIVYAQLQSGSDDYTRYLLMSLVDSLSRRYSEKSGKTGIRELAGGMLRLASPALKARVQRLADDSWEGRGNVTDYINQLVDELIEEGKLSSFDPDLLRVMLYALRPDQKTTSCVYKYLSCERMNPHDMRALGDVVPKTRDDDPHWMIRDLGRFAALTDRALVLMVDQADLAGFEANSTMAFRRAIDALYRITSELSSSVAVIACLSDLYETVRGELNRPALDRIERDPPPAKLQVNRSYAEIEAVVARRLSWLFTEHGTVHRPEEPVYPIPEAELKHMEHRRLRDVLEWCHQFQTQCMAAGKIIDSDQKVMIVDRNKRRDTDLDLIAAAWNDATHAQGLDVPDEEHEILAAVSEAAKAYCHEAGLSLSVTPRKNGILSVHLSRGETSGYLAIAVTNHSYHGGAFTGQIEALRKKAKGATPIAVRTLEFPRGRACDKAMGKLVDAGGRGAYLDASTLRVLVAFKNFQLTFPTDRLAVWQQRDRPISSLPAISELFDFDRLLAGRSKAPAPASDSSDAWPAVEQAGSDAALTDRLRASVTSTTPKPAGPVDSEPWTMTAAQEPSRVCASSSENPWTPQAENTDGVPPPASRDNGTTNGPSGRRRTRATPPRDTRFAGATPSAPEVAARSGRPPASTDDDAQADELASTEVRGVPPWVSPVAAQKPDRGAAASSFVTRSATAAATATTSPASPNSGARATKASSIPSVWDGHSPQTADTRPSSGRNGGSSAPAATTGGGPLTSAAVMPAMLPSVTRGAPAELATTPPSSVTPPRAPAGTTPPKTAVSERSVPRPGTQSASQIWVGNSTSISAPTPRMLELSALLDHIAIIENTGNGRLTLGLNLIEQVLEREIPAIVLDPSGAVSGYARSEWWRWTAEQDRARRLAERIDVRLFTPGGREGRPLSLPMIPNFSQAPGVERARNVQHAANELATMMGFDALADAACVAVLMNGIAMVAECSPASGLDELLKLIKVRDRELVARTRGYDESVRRRLVDELARLISSPDVFVPGSEPLTMDTLIGRGAGGKVPLSIVSTRFLGDATRIQAWVAHLLGCLNRDAARTKSGSLRAMIVIDGVELFLPAGAAKPLTKGPLQELLVGARAAGLGIVLASQRSGELDYRPCGLINAWFVGRTADTQSVDRMKLLFEHRPLGRNDLARLESGRCLLLQDKGAAVLERGQSLLRPEEVIDTELLGLAAATSPRAQSRSRGSDERPSAPPR